METRGRKPVYSTAQSLKLKVEEYISLCDEKKAFPDFAGMRIFLKVTKRQLDDMCNPEFNENWEAYQEVLDYAKDCRESRLIRAMVTDNKKAQGCLNALKQIENGGYADKTADTDKTINIKISKEDAELFK